MVSSNNIKKIPSKTIPPPSSKNKLIMSTSTIDDNKSLQKRWYCYSPATPPRSPQITPTISQKPSENDQSLITPPLLLHLIQLQQNLLMIINPLFKGFSSF
ncbi:unnamed protein product [Rhizophagus irregularis]|nr:unnamed protein product [Rhizophagus irregularis]